MSVSRRFIVLLVLCAVALCGLSVAQYVPPGGMPAPGGTGSTPAYTPKSYGVNKAMIGAGVGGAVAGGILFYELRHRGIYQGCVGPDGKTLTRTKDGHQFKLEGEPLQAGESVSIKAKKDGNDSSGDTLEVANVRKDFGRCEDSVASTASARQR